MAGLVLEDGRTWGDAAEPLQLTDAREAIEGPEPFHFWTRSRGRAKTSDAGGVGLSLLLAAPPRARLYLAAADQDQAALAHDSIAGYVARTPLLHGQLTVQARSVVVPSTGATLEVLASDAASSFGLRPWALIVDELSAWSDTPGPRRFWGSLSSAMAKIAGSRLLVVTSAGDPRHFSHAVLDHARTSPLWRTSEAPGPSPWMSPERIAEQRARLPEPVYRALFENEWIEAEGAFLEAEGAFLDAEAIRRAFTLSGPSAPMDGRSYVAALDLGLVNDRTVLAVGHREGAAIHLDHLQAWRGTKARPVDLAEVRDAVIHAHERYGLRILKFDRWQAHRLAEELSSAGIRCEPFEFTSASKQRYSAALLQTLNEGSLRLYEPGGLEDELRGLTIRTTGSGWAFDHGRGGHDDQAVALALAILELLSVVPSTTASISTLPVPDSRRAITRSGIRLVGRQYLDVVPGQRERVPPPGWTETTTPRRTR
jgi:hypothetical protein